MKQSIAFLTVIFICQFASAQILKAVPYLEDVEPDHVHISWITDSNNESTINWGLTVSLDNSTSGGQFTTVFGDVVHEVVLTGLTPNTKYYYQAVTGSVSSNVYSFHTPDLSIAEQSFNIVAMSDMQRDGSNPQKFDEIVNDGIIPIIQEKYGEDISANLGLIMIPGDLVVNGLDYNSWMNQFFQQMSELTAQVPVYPVLGNHEVNSPYYFDFFHLPNNGTSGFEEHWWYKDYSNVRIIGLNSNSPYNGATQLTWLQTVLNETETADSIDFVFAQLHHPHESELWLPGESGFSTSVVQILETFTDNSGKPSIHFFGHTHGYSRGQSKDHEHLMVNVATAGGAIDHWGEWPQNDYRDFTVTHADYGFVILEVEAGDDPQFTLKRFSQGHQYAILDNVVRDSITVKRNNILPETPIGVSPNGVTVSPDCLLLVGSPFSDTDGHDHMASEWQISTNSSDFNSPIYESFVSHQNWYFFEDTQAGEIMVDEKIESAPENSTLYWRVRYRDNSLGWSDWSTPVEFFTGTSVMSANLIQNTGAETGTGSWIVDAGNLESLTAGECAGTSPNTGLRYFGVGGLCIDAAYGEAHQNVDVSSYQISIDEGTQYVRWGAYMSDYNGADIPEIQVVFLDNLDNEIGSSNSITSSVSSWTYYEDNTLIPIGTNSINFILKGTRNGGVDNDSYIDDIFLHIVDGQCDDSTFDEDEDGIIDSIDNCLGLVNSDQADFNDNGVGDLCEDSDLDGLSDADEINIYGTDPSVADSDLDGLSDYEEVMTSLTNPNLQDSDFDGLTDALELNISLTDPNDPDSDNDGCTDDLFYGELCFEGNIVCEIDTNGDNQINILDLLAISSYFGQSCE